MQVLHRKLMCTCQTNVAYGLNECEMSKCRVTHIVQLDLCAIFFDVPEFLQLVHTMWIDEYTYFFLKVHKFILVKQIPLP